MSRSGAARDLMFATVLALVVMVVVIGVLFWWGSQIWLIAAVGVSGTLGLGVIGWLITADDEEGDDDGALFWTEE